MRTGSAALGFAITESRRPSRDWTGFCLMFTRTCFLVAALHPSAIRAWLGTPAKDRHTGGGDPPAGVPVYWSGGKHGHVALSAGGGFCWSTDILRRGKVDKVRISTITTRWNYRYLGWASSINGVRVYDAPAEPRRPRVGLERVRDAARRDPDAKQGKASHPGDVKVIERALVKEGLLDDRWLDGSFGTKTVRAYARWEKRIGVKGNGIPDEVSLRRLANKHGFEVVV